jgi:hypothetical protein
LLVVFAFQIEVLDSKNQGTFNTKTDIQWAEFRSCIVRILGGSYKVQLSGRIGGERKWVILNSADELGNIMQRVVQKANNARTKAVALEVKNAAVSLFAIGRKEK